MKIAIVKLSALGDIVHALAAVQIIRTHRPDVSIDWIVEAGLAEILQGNPEIDHIYPVQLKALKTNKTALWREIKRIRTYAKNHYDVVIDAQGLLKSAVVARLLGRNVVGFDRDSIREKIACRFYRQKLSIPYEDNVIERNLKLLTAPLGIAYNHAEIDRKQPFLYYTPTELTCVAPQRKNILLVLGASKPNKVYPQERWVEVVRGIQAQTEAHFIALWANDAERAMAEHIVAHTTDCVLADRVSLNGLKALIAQMDLVMGGDTGPTHCAWGLNRPSLTIFGNTPATRNMWRDEQHRAITSNSVVNPRRLDANDFSIREIPADEMVAAAVALLNLSPLSLA